MKRFAVLWICCLTLQACAAERGRVYFPAGNADRGREAFDTLGCRGCHRIAQVDPPFRGSGAASVSLGGQTARVQTYGALVTSIINPSHKLIRGYPAEAITANGESIMSLANLNDVVTVQQLVDLLAFLQVIYQIAPPPNRVFREIYPANGLDEAIQQ